MTYEIYFKAYSKSENLLALHEAAWLLSEGLTVNKDLKKAIRFCKELINRESPFKLAYFLIADCYKKNNNYDLAIENYYLGIKYFRSLENINIRIMISDSYYNIAKCFEMLNKYNDALSIYTKITNINYIKRKVKQKAKERISQIKNMQIFGICKN
jgi:tetratricopeptide (TPR) repeat protein